MAARPFADGLFRFVFAACQSLDRREKKRRHPDGVGTLGNSPLDPANRVAVAAGAEMRTADAEAARRTRNWVCRAEGSSELKTLDRLVLLAVVDAYPAAAGPRPGRSAIEDKGAVGMDGRHLEIAAQCVAGGQNRLGQGIRL